MSVREGKFGEGISWPDAWQVRYVAETGSTNDDLLGDLESVQARQFSVLATGHQTAGRGRLDRRWEAPAGANLLVSLAFEEVPDPPVELTHRLGLALCAVVDDLIDGESSAPRARCGLKWPNDVLLDGRKLAGLLAIRSAVTGGVVVGAGVNVRWAPEGAARLHELDTSLTPAELLMRLLVAYDGLPADVSELYRSRLLTLGQSVRASLPDGTEIEGRAVGVDPRGRLLVLDGCAMTHHLDAADVVHLRPRR